MRFPKAEIQGLAPSRDPGRDPSKGPGSGTARVIRRLARQLDAKVRFRWAEALRSGEWAQMVASYEVRGTNGRCAVGVLGEVGRQDGLNPDHIRCLRPCISSDGERTWFDWAGMDADTFRRLLERVICLNDVQQWPFEDIANAIEPQS